MVLHALGDELPVFHVPSSPMPWQGQSRIEMSSFMEVKSYRLGSSRLRVDIGDSGAGTLGQ